VGRLVRHRNSKRLSYRVGGRFARQPGLTRADEWAPCDHCGATIYHPDEAGRICPMCDKPARKEARPTE